MKGNACGKLKFKQSTYSKIHLNIKWKLQNDIAPKLPSILYEINGQETVILCPGIDLLLKIVYVAMQIHWIIIFFMFIFIIKFAAKFEERLYMHSQV